MLAESFFLVIRYIVVSFLLCIIGWAVAYKVQGDYLASKFFEAWIFDFNGLLIGGITWGLLHLVSRESKTILYKLGNILKVNEEIDKSLLIENRNLLSWKKIYLFGILLGLPGMYTLWTCGYPLSGFSKIYLFIGSGSLHLTAAIILIYIFYIIKFFRFLENKIEFLDIRSNVSKIEMDSFNLFFVITATMGLLAGYLAFRGTITAGFNFPDDMHRKLLLYPLIVYFPLGLFYSFYPRFVLKKINDKSIIQEIERVDELNSSIAEESKLSIKEQIELKSIIYDLKNRLQIESKKFPLLSVQDYPSLIIVFFMLLQYVMQEDSAITEFIKSLSN